MKIDARIAIVMPVYNEASSIKTTIMELYDVIIKHTDNIDLWVFEDGSTDGTKEILADLSTKLPRLFVRTEKDRKGYSRAMKEAILAVDQKTYQFILTLDSDGQYDPRDFFKLWDIMQREEVDIVMGKRIRRTEPIYRRFLSWGLKILEKIMFSVQCNDVTSVMRLMKTEVAHKIATMVKYSKYNFWLEFTAWMSIFRCRVIEVPINYRKREGKSRVYNFRKMPRVVISELKTLYSVWRESRWVVENG